MSIDISERQLPELGRRRGMIADERASRSDQVLKLIATPASLEKTDLSVAPPPGANAAFPPSDPTVPTRSATPSRPPPRPAQPDRVLPGQPPS